jgi:hypothetical protein
MNDGIMMVNQQQRTQTFTALLLSTGVTPKNIQYNLATPTYPVGLSYQTGAILAFDGSGDFINCDPAAGSPQNTAVAILYDDRLLASDDTGALLPPNTGTIVGEQTPAIEGEFKVDATKLFATLVNLSDVDAAMTSMGAVFNPGSNSYSKF